MNRSSRFLLTAGAALATFCLLPRAKAQDAHRVVQQMVANEDTAGLHRQHFTYTATERSDRTNGHLWRERVVETTQGKMRLLLEVDGQALSPEGDAGERSRLAGILANPASFIAAERARKNDDDKAKSMLDLLPTAFLVENARTEREWIRLDFRPNPDYQTRSTEEKVLHGMSGTFTVDPHAMRLHELAARLPQDISVGFGLATIHAGSSFAMRRDHVTADQWKTALVETSINGKAMLFKSLGKNEHVERTGIRLIPFDTTLPQAVALLEQ